MENDPKQLPDSIRATVHRPVIGDAPEQSNKLLRRIIPKALHPTLRGVRKRLKKENYRAQEPFCHTYTYTQVSLARQDSILSRCTDLVATGIEGDFVECGVLDGGTSALMAYAARADDRRIQLFDAWQGLPAATRQDGPGSENWAGDVVGSQRRAMNIIEKVGGNMANIVVNRGWFNDTLPVSTVEKIAFLHIDCDFYEPTKLVLETFVPRVVSGGCIQIDDYTSYEGCRVAVNEFLADHPQYELVIENKPGGAIYFVSP